MVVETSAWPRRSWTVLFASLVEVFAGRNARIGWAIEQECAAGCRTLLDVGRLHARHRAALQSARQDAAHGRRDAGAPRLNCQS